MQINWVINDIIVKKKNYYSFILPNALEENLPLTEESILALDNLKSYVDEAKNLLTNIENQTIEIFFIDELPEEGIENKIYINKQTNKIYYWSKGNFIQISSSGNTDFDILFGGNAYAQ